MKFGEILESLKKGEKAQRKGWNGKGMYIFDFYHSVLKLKANTELEDDIYHMTKLEGIIEIGLDDTFKFENFVILKTAGNTCIPWNASQADMLAEDWETIK